MARRLCVDPTYEVELGTTSTGDEWHEMHVFVDGRRLSTYRRSERGLSTEPGATLDRRYYHADLLGSNQLVTDDQGAGAIAPRSAIRL